VRRRAERRKTKVVVEVVVKNHGFEKERATREVLREVGARRAERRELGSEEGERKGWGRGTRNYETRRRKGPNTANKERRTKNEERRTKI
jgi:hypothetical protein